MQQVKYYSFNELSASHALIFYFIFFYLYFENLVTITVVITYSVKKINIFYKCNYCTTQSSQYTFNLFDF